MSKQVPTHNPALLLWDLDDELFASDQRIRDWDLFRLFQGLGIIRLFDEFENSIKWSRDDFFGA